MPMKDIALDPLFIEYADFSISDFQGLYHHVNFDWRPVLNLDDVSHVKAINQMIDFAGDRLEDRMKLGFCYFRFFMEGQAEEFLVACFGECESEIAGSGVDVFVPA